MLQTIRDKLTGWVAIIVILIIGLALLISFGNMNMDAATGQFAARVNGDEIAMLEYREAFQAQLLRQQEAFQGELPAPLQEQLQRNVLEGLVQQKVLAQFIDEEGYRVDDQRVAAFIRNQPAFQVGGEFASQAYIALLANQGLTPELYEERTRRALQINQVQTGLLESAFYTPSEYRQFIELQQQRRQATVVQVSPASLFAGVEVDEAAIEAYYADNAARFQTEESVSIEYVEIRLADIAADVAVEEAALMEYYEENRPRYATEEERRLRHILIAVDGDTDEAAAAELAAELRDRLTTGEPFADLAREFSDDPGSAPDGGELGWAGRGVYVTAFEEAAFALQPDAVSAPVKTEFGYHLIQLQEVRPGSEQPFEEVRAEILDQLQKQAAENSFFEQAELLDDLALENPGGLRVVAEQAGLPLQRAESITRSGGEPFGFNAALIEAAFSPAVLEDGENSALIEVEDARALVLRVVEHRLPEARPLDEVRATIAGELRLQEASRLALAQGQQLLERVQGGEDLGLVAIEYGLDVQQTELIPRNADSLPAEITAAVFRAPASDTGGVYDGIETADGGYAVFRLDRVEPGRPEAVPREQRDQAKQQLALQLGNADFGSLVVDLRGAASVQVAADTFTDPEPL